MNFARSQVIPSTVSLAVVTDFDVSEWDIVSQMNEAEPMVETSATQLDRKEF